MRDYLSKESKFLLGSGALKKAPGPFFYDFFGRPKRDHFQTETPTVQECPLSFSLDFFLVSTLTFVSERNSDAAALEWPLAHGSNEKQFL